MAEQEKVDVVIAGAGASGSTFAAVLAKAGKKVVLIDNGPDWQEISQSTAEAASEGGSLFGGGVQVSDAEKATLGEISSALGV